MNTDIKTEWIAALRSGKYKQGRGKLRVDDKFCCLGVLCDLYDNKNWFDTKEIHIFGQGSIYSYSLDNTVNRNFLPYHVQKGLQLKYEDTVELAQMNDDGKTFDEIADHIEENF